MISTSAVVLAALGFFAGTGHELSGLVEDCRGQAASRRRGLAIRWLETGWNDAQLWHARRPMAAAGSRCSSRRCAKVGTVAGDALGLGLPGGSGPGDGSM